MDFCYRQVLVERPRSYKGLPSVTSILAVLEDPFYIRKWKESAEDPTVVDEIVNNARKRGTYIHLVLADYYKTKQLNFDSSALTQYKEKYGLPELDSSVVRFLAGVNKFISTIDVTPMSVEEPIAEEQLGFAGTPDLIGIYEGKISLIDWKTSATANITGDSLERYLMQMAAYAAMWNYRNPDKLIEQLVLVPFTKARKAGLGEIVIIDNKDEIKLFFYKFIACFDQWKIMWPQSPFYPEMTEVHDNLLVK